MPNAGYIFLITMLLLDWSCDTSKVPVTISANPNHNFSLEEFKKDKRNYYPFESGRFELFPVVIIMQNNSDSVMLYWEMTCSWPWNWSLSDSSFAVYCGPCSKNVPTIKKIGPHKSITYQGLIYCPKEYAELINEEIKLCFVWIREGDYGMTADHTFPNFYDLLRIKRNIKQNLVWSNSFHLR